MTKTLTTAEHPDEETEAILYGSRALTYMALKRFKLAREDCKQLISSHPHNKDPRYLYRLAKCNLALGSHEIARDILSEVLETAPTYSEAIYLLAEADLLKSRLINLDLEIESQNWDAVIDLIGDCLVSLEAEGAEVPFQWRVWRIEAEIKRGNWEKADTESRCVAHS
jgi:DnaJ homolog subfamily C member 7